MAVTTSAPPRPGCAIWMLIATRCLQILKTAYGRAAAGRWLHRWRMFFLAVAELFGYGNGESGSSLITCCNDRPTLANEVTPCLRSSLTLSRPWQRSSA